MDIALRVADNFAPSPEALRDRVLAAEFRTEIGPDGVEYTGICLDHNPNLSEEIAKLTGFKIKEKLSFYRINYAMEVSRQFVHSDLLCAEYAGVLYMNRPEHCFGGTALWKHKQCDWDAMPTDAELTQQSVDVGKFKEEMQEEWLRREPWDMTGFVGMKFNRFVTYPANIFHSRYPHEAFGDRKSNARLIWVIFYDRERSN